MFTLLWRHLTLCAQVCWGRLLRNAGAGLWRVFALGYEAVAPVLQREAGRAWPVATSKQQRVDEVREAVCSQAGGCKEHLGLSILTNTLPANRTPPRLSQSLPGLSTGSVLRK